MLVRTQRAGRRRWVVVPVAALLAAPVVGCTADDDRGPARRTEPSAATTAGARTTSPRSPVTTPAGVSPGWLQDQLIKAAWANDVRRARRLIEAGADVNAKDDTEQSAYLVATSEGYLDLLDLTLRPRRRPRLARTASTGPA